MKHKLILKIEGMHCTSCAGIIERTLRKITGVSSANVNFATEKALVVYDENKIESPKLF